MDNKDFEVIARHADPPANWRKVHPDLKNKTSLVARLAGFGFTIVMGLFVNLMLSLLMVMFFGYVAGIATAVIILLITILFMVSTFQESDYARYATWVYENTPAEPSTIRLTLKFRTPHNIASYYATVTNESGDEEVYDIKLLWPPDYNQFLVGEGVPARTHRDPNNQQVVMVESKGIHAWLQEYAP